ncbi:thiol-disulfide oxidoreductase ResA [Brevibacillus sp. B_LB10_24]|uniref:thiol-disulfide oxidoreductase ResA n=1 Tax=Brevibacillus sp. B_LB10_24 TaxID=3380645 RepID=UPI0038B7962F
MNKRSRTPIRIAILGVLLVALVFAIYSSYAKSGEVGVGDAAPNFSLKQLDGTPMKLSDLQGKAVLLNFWASWCDPCKAEMPDLEKEYGKWKDKGLVVVGVNIGETPLIVNQFVEPRGLTFPILLDAKNEITKLYNIGPIPTSFFIDANGKVVDKVVGQMNEAIIESKVAKILR